MNTSPTTHLLSDVAGGGPIPEANLAYLEQRVLNAFYAFVMAKFFDEKKKSGLTQAKLARRINRGTDVVNRWLASPGNWQIGTLARLLVGISGEEAALSSVPLLGRTPRNQTVLDLLDDQDDPAPRPLPVTQATGSDVDVAKIWFEPIDG